MKFFLLIVILLSSFSSAEENASNWLSSPPKDFLFQNQIPLESVHEIIVSKKENAFLVYLNKKPFVEISADEAKSFTHVEFSKKDNEHIYLLRAVYTNGNTGYFYLYRNENSLLVSHQSLGKSTGLHQSALVVTLSFQPSSLYVFSSGAM
jgi:hypothetical protein